ncbi:P-loop ATPase, Sll1717 family [Mesorhizobium sp. L-2-11]|uniref:P-loop ATPase, Sll1717 family n=1 Tax=Mesorhizobium sp. L-2-11 TaxID=2744521 RepID=UPI001926A6F7|nr:hypothetical protein [Mesorhizobium sp. L-2-11]BCH19673.1 hypothetical protein MesoLjLa_65240 [Mesorhizobium sp. L-2-11]
MKAFFAYPSSERDVIEAIHSAKQSLSQSRRDLEVTLWQENDISGRPLTDPIFEAISESDMLFADVTTMNFNVTFEIAYAIGLGKRVHLVRDQNIAREASLITKIGIFDTLGFTTYSEGHGLARILQGATPENPLPLKVEPNKKAPVYILNTPTSNAPMLAIGARVKKSRLGFRSFIPQEEIRMSASKAVVDISACMGVIVPLLQPSFVDADIHNVRAAFIAGLAFGLGKVTLILQPPDGPAPLDVRDMVKTFSHAEDIAEFINEFALDVTERMQADDPLAVPKGSFLSELSIGDAVAENEFQTLARYYLRTDQYGRASRGEVNLVVGRKGAGKTALFSQLRNEKRAKVQNIVVDLKPEGYQLIRLKEDVLDYLAEGARTHLITALFEYVLYLEICYKVLEKDKTKYMRDGRLYDPYLALQKAYESGDASEGDFSERLQALSRSLVEGFKRTYGQSDREQRLTSAQVTELVYKHNIKDVREALSAYLEFKDSVWVLFDNLDKGWSAHGLNDEDVTILRALIDAARKIQRQMQSDEHDFHCVVFVRNDVYQLLVEASADYGKESRAVLDWTEPDVLREMLRRRLISGLFPPKTPFEKVWSSVAISHYRGEETSSFLIERSLMRPRNLIKLISHCRGFAVGLGHEKIEQDDIEKGLRSYSLDLITDADQELTDILGADTTLIYHFIGEGESFSRDQLEKICRGAEIAPEKIESVIEFLLYYGFMGIHHTERTTYIFNVNYDMKHLKVLEKKAGANVTYTLSPAFHAGLN